MWLAFSETELPRWRVPVDSVRSISTMQESLEFDTLTGPAGGAR